MISVTELVPVVKGACGILATGKKKHEKTNPNIQTNEKIMLQSSGKIPNLARFMKPLQEMQKRLESLADTRSFLSSG